MTLEMLFGKKQWENKQKKEDESLNKISCCLAVQHAEKVVECMKY